MDKVIFMPVESFLKLFGFRATQGSSELIFVSVLKDYS